MQAIPEMSANRIEQFSHPSSAIPTNKPTNAASSIIITEHTVLNSFITEDTS